MAKNYEKFMNLLKGEPVNVDGDNISISNPIMSDTDQTFIRGEIEKYKKMVKESSKEWVDFEKGLEDMTKQFLSADKKIFENNSYLDSRQIHLKAPLETTVYSYQLNAFMGYLSKHLKDCQPIIDKTVILNDLLRQSIDLSKEPEQIKKHRTYGVFIEKSDVAKNMYEMTKEIFDNLYIEYPDETYTLKHTTPETQTMENLKGELLTDGFKKIVSLYNSDVMLKFLTVMSINYDDSDLNPIKEGFLRNFAKFDPRNAFKNSFIVIKINDGYMKRLNKELVLNDVVERDTKIYRDYNKFSLGSDEKAIFIYEFIHRLEKNFDKLFNKRDKDHILATKILGLLKEQSSKLNVVRGFFRIFDINSGEDTSNWVNKLDLAFNQYMDKKKKIFSFVKMDTREGQMNKRFRIKKLGNNLKLDYINTNKKNDKITDEIPETYFYGSFDDIFEIEEDFETSVNIMVNSIYKKLWPRIKEAEPVCIFGYGQSGAGKTTNLVYNNFAEEDGVVIELIKKIKKDNIISDLKLRAVELLVDPKNPPNNKKEARKEYIKRDLVKLRQLMDQFEEKYQDLMILRRDDLVTNISDDGSGNREIKTGIPRYLDGEENSNFVEYNFDLDDDDNLMVLDIPQTKFSIYMNETPKINNSIRSKLGSDNYNEEDNEEINNRGDSNDYPINTKWFKLESLKISPTSIIKGTATNLLTELNKLYPENLSDLEQVEIKDDFNIEITKSKEDESSSTKLVPKYINETEEEKLGTYINSLFTLRSQAPTSNNPDSSRSHVLLELSFTHNRRTCKIIIGDFAGVEDEFNCENEDLRNRFLEAYFNSSISLELKNKIGLYPKSLMDELVTIKISKGILTLNKGDTLTDTLRPIEEDEEITIEEMKDGLLNEIEKICKKRRKEGYLINSSLEDLRNELKKLIKSNIKNNASDVLPIFFDTSVYPYCRNSNLDVNNFSKFYEDTSIDSEPKKSVLLKMIYELLDNNKDQLNKLITTIFTVINLRESTGEVPYNNPPPVPYINLSKLVKFKDETSKQDVIKKMISEFHQHYNEDHYTYNKLSISKLFNIIDVENKSTLLGSLETTMELQSITRDYTTCFKFDDKDLGDTIQKLEEFKFNIDTVTDRKYFEKYLKYKSKYLSLRSKLNI